MASVCAGLLGMQDAQHRQILSAHSPWAMENNFAPQTAKSPFKATMSAHRRLWRIVTA